MSMDVLSSDKVYDVVICGGGLAGLTLALQLRLHQPSVSVLILERQSPPIPEAAFKVGESTVETGAYYLAETLQLREYLKKEHFAKFGLRFFYAKDNGPMHSRPELGLSCYPDVTSYQLDRGILERDLRHFVRDAGALLYEGCLVKDISLNSGDEPHNVYIVDERRKPIGEVRARWVIDAMGRRRYIQKKLGLCKSAEREHSAAWFRLEGRIDVAELVPSTEKRWHQRVSGGERYYSTNHLLSHGYWVWIIPLPSGNTSVGIVTSDEIHPFETYNTPAKALQWLKDHEPAFHSYVGGLDFLDFRCMHDYSYSSEQLFSLDRWACVGDAGVFADPYYSPGTDLIGFSNLMVGDLIKLDLEGSLEKDTVEIYDRRLLSLNHWLTRNIQLAYSVFGNPVVAACKTIWDVAAAWSVVAPRLFNGVFADEKKSRAFQKGSAGFFFLTQQVQRLFVDWATKSNNRFDFEFIDYLSIPFMKEFNNRNLVAGKTSQQLLEDQNANMALLEELAQALFLIALEDTDPEQLQHMPSPLWLNAWGIDLDPQRWEAQRLFQPSSSPRPLEPMLCQLREVFRR